VEWVEIDTGKGHTQSPSKVARSRDYYRLPVEELGNEDVPEMLFETLLSEIESDGKVAIDALLAEGSLPSPRRERLQLSMLMATQYVRGERGRAAVRESASRVVKALTAGHDEDSIVAFLKRRHLETTPEQVALARRSFEMLANGEIKAEPHPATQMAIAAQPVEQITEVLFNKSWVLYRGQGVITSDEPVVTVGGPGSDRRAVAGLMTASVVMFPVSPEALLVMHRPGRFRYPTATLNARETEQANVEIAANATRLLFDQPGKSTIHHMKIPQRLEESVEWVEYGDFIHYYRKSRWANEKVPPPWPVQRWYR
jgi:hypothetical protein